MKSISEKYSPVNVDQRAELRSLYTYFKVYTHLL